jgi:hypothetical protein
LLGDFNAKLGRGNIFKSTISNESIHLDSNDNGVGIKTLPPIFTLAYTIFRCVNQLYVKVMVISVKTQLYNLQVFLFLSLAATCFGHLFGHLQAILEIGGLEL